MGNRLKVLIAAGGSGGHLFPAQQLGRLLKGSAEVAFAGHKLSESPFFQREGFPFVEIAASPLKRGFIKASLRGFWQALKWIRSFQPDVVVGFGSFHSFPVLAAAVLLRKKLVLFEANCAVGKVNRLFLPFARKIAGQFHLPVKKSALVPLLPWRIEEKKVEKAREYFGLSQEKLTLLIFGGSQGASFLNETMPEACKMLRDRGHDIQVIHLSGKGEVHYALKNSFPREGDSPLRKGAASSLPHLTDSSIASSCPFNACVKPFEKEMAKAYAAADVAICRSGAGTMAELIRYRVPALLIPFPYATEDHQRKNGEFLAQHVKGARLLLQKEATLEKIVQEVETLLKRRKMLQKALEDYSLQSEGRIGLGEIVHVIGKN